MTPPDRRPEYGLLTATLVGEVLGWTGPDRRLSRPVRDELLRVLPTVLVDAASRQSYLGRLNDLRRDAGAKRQMNRVAAGVDLPLAALAGSGPNGLSDEELAALATDPLQLEATADAIEALAQTGELGQTWWDAMSRAGQAAYPTPPDRPTAPKSDSGGNDAVASGPNRAAKKPRRLLTALPWAITAAAVAFTVGVWAWRGAGGETGFKMSTAQAGVEKVTPRGGNTRAFEVSVTADRTGFATIILLTPGQRPRVSPDYGQDEKRVGPEAVADGPFEATAGTTVLVVVTETPATDLVRRAVATLTPDVTTPDAVRERIRERLTAFGHRWAAVGSAVVVDPNP